VKSFIALALAGLVLAGCSSAEKEAQKELGYTRSQQTLDAAQRSATVECRDAAQCDAVWKLTKTYVEQHSGEPVIRADETAINTDVPSGTGKPVFSATRVQKGSGAIVTLYAQCRGMYGPEHSMGSDYDDCATKIISTQRQFPDYLNSHLPGK
jgi:hypothetical protein